MTEKDLLPNQELNLSPQAESHALSPLYHQDRGSTVCGILTISALCSSFLMIQKFSDWRFFGMSFAYQKNNPP